MSKIIAFFGSPRKDGYTAKLVHSALRGAQEAGAEVITYDLNDPSIRGCQGCFYCRKHADCATQDALSAMYGDIAGADGIIAGIPIYLWGISGQAKIWIDRLYPMLNSDFTPRCPGKKIITIYAQGNADKDKFNAAINTCHYIFEKFGWELCNTLLASGSGAKQYEMPQMLSDEAYAAGRRLARTSGA